MEGFPIIGWFISLGFWLGFGYAIGMLGIWLRNRYWG